MTRALLTLEDVREAKAIIEDLVAQTRQQATDPSDPESLRAAFATVLEQLEIDPDELLAWQDGTDIVGGAYERILTGEQRRAAGQFYTPFWAGDLMAGWIFQEPRKLAADPGVGSGALLITAARHPKRGKARLLGVDLDPLAATMLKMNAVIRDIDGLDAQVGNFLLDDLTEQPDAITCNPPYSRHHDIPADDKVAIHEGFEKRLGLTLSRLAALHALFLVRALEVSAPGARLAFITPSDWLDVNYGRKVKEYALENATVEAIVLLEAEHLFFDGVLTTAAITFIRNEKAPKGHKTKILRLTRDLPAPAAVLKQLASGDGVEEIELSASEKWSRPKATTRKGIRLGDLARVRRGIATGSNSFFVISERQRHKLLLSKRDLRPCLTSPRVFTGTELTKEALESFDLDVPRWVLNKTDENAIYDDTPLGNYLRYGRDELKVHEGYLASKRKPWYAPEQRGDCPILFSYFNRARPRFVRNHVNAVPLNNWLIIEPKEGVDPDVLYEALTSKAAMAQLEERARVYGGGLWKLEPSELSEIRLNDKRLKK